jgi:fluoride exporter
LPTFISFVGVFVGSGMGGMLRHGISLIAIRYGGLTFPWGTLVINIVGSALIGLVVGLFAARIVANAELRLFLTTGLIGGFTTWSTFTLDAFTLWERGEPYAAAGYVAGSLVLSFAALTAVLIAARQWS